MSGDEGPQLAGRSARMAQVGAVGGVVAGLIAAACCLGPPILVALGLGGVAAAAGLASIRPYMIAVSALLLGVGFYLAYGPMERACRADGQCISPKIRRMTKAMLWTATVLFSLFVTADWWIGLFA